MYMVIADGQVWTDSDGVREFDQPGAIALADALQRIGYDTTIEESGTDDTDEWEDLYADDLEGTEEDEDYLYNASDPYDIEYDV